MNTQYISFCGTFYVPENADALAAKFKYEEIFQPGDDRYPEVSTGFRDGLSYNVLDSKDSLTVYLAKVSDGIGHLVARCPEGGWTEETFVFLDESGNPIEQL